MAIRPASTLGVSGINRLHPVYYDSRYSTQAMVERGHGRDVSLGLDASDNKMNMRFTILFGAALLLSPHLPDLLGQCDIIEAEDEARAITGMPAVAHMAGLDEMCRQARAEIEELGRQPGQ
jgi:hypothetical protein